MTSAEPSDPGERKKVGSFLFSKTIVIVENVGRVSAPAHQLRPVQIEFGWLQNWLFCFNDVVDDRDVRAPGAPAARWDTVVEPAREDLEIVVTRSAALV